MSLREVYVKDSSPSKYSLKCRATGCTFYVHAYVPKNEIHWVASIMLNHSCTLQNLGKMHCNLTASLIANELYSEIIEKRDMECSFIQRSVCRQFKYDITYQKAWRAKQIALEKRWGSYESYYQDQNYWMTRKNLMFDVFVEDYAVHRVMRQFGLRQQVPVPLGDRVDPAIHA